MKLSLSTTRSPDTVLSCLRYPTFEQSRKDDFSRYHLHSLRKSIQQKKSVNSRIHEQLKIQHQSSQKLLSQLKSSMLQTQKNGVDFVTRYQQQKHKNECLQQLVRHYQKQISQQKLKQYHHNMSNIENNEYDQLRNALHQRGKLLQTVTNKLNVSQCQKRAKYQIVKCERRERTVFSNQFNPFQQELFDLHYQYKQQLIERALMERQLEDKKKQFQKVSVKQKKDLQAIQMQSHQLHQQYTLNKDNHNIQQSQFYTCNIPTNSSVYRNKSKINCIKIDKSQIISKNELYQQKNQKKINNLQHLKTIQNILNDLSVNTTKELYQLFTQTQKSQEDKLTVIQKLNEHKASSIQMLSDDIYEWDKLIDQLIFKIQNQPINVRPSTSQNQSLKRVNDIFALTKRVDQQIDSQKSEISNINCSENLQTLIQLLDLSSQQLKSIKQFEDENQLNRIDARLMQEIQKKFTKLISHQADSKNISRANNNRKSLFWQLPTSQPQQKDSSLMMTQKSICPLQQSSRVHHNTKKMKTGISQQIGGYNGLKKLSNLLRNQSKITGPIDVVSKDQMIKEANEAFDKDGIINMEKYQVNYS